MSDNLILKVKNDFPLDTFLNEVKETYAQKGYTIKFSDKLSDHNIETDVYLHRSINSTRMGTIYIEKNMNSFLKYCGLAEKISICYVFEGNDLEIYFRDQEIFGKIVAYFLGSSFSILIIPIILVITAFIGTIKQRKLHKNISSILLNIISKF